LEVIGSHASVDDPQHALDPQHEASFSPAATEAATFPYFSRTAPLMSSFIEFISIEFS
jgi:hypothetical protein